MQNRPGPSKCSFFTVLLTVAACLLVAVRGRASQDNSSFELAGIRKVISGIVAADNAGDAAAVMNFYEDDAVLLPPNGSPVVGKSAIRTRYEDGFRRFRFDISSKSDETRALGEWALTGERHPAPPYSKTMRFPNRAR
jgi:hypothetical protein